MKKIIIKLIATMVLTSFLMVVIIGFMALAGWLVEFLCADNKRFVIGVSILTCIIWQMIQKEMSL